MGASCTNAGGTLGPCVLVHLSNAVFGSSGGPLLVVFHHMTPRQGFLGVIVGPTCGPSPCSILCYSVVPLSFCKSGSFSSNWDGSKGSRVFCYYGLYVPIPQHGWYHHHKQPLSIAPSHTLKIIQRGAFIDFKRTMWRWSHSSMSSSC